MTDMLPLVARFTKWMYRGTILIGRTVQSGVLRFTRRMFAERTEADDYAARLVERFKRRFDV